MHSSTGVTPAVLTSGRQPSPPATTRSAQAIEQRETEARDAWLERLRDLEPVKRQAAAKSAEEHQHQAAYCNAHRREVEYTIDDLVMKRNRILSSAAQGISMKLAPKYAGPLRVTDVIGFNTVKVFDEHGKSEEALHVSQLKPGDERPGDEQPAASQRSAAERDEIGRETSAVRNSETEPRHCEAPMKAERLDKASGVDGGTVFRHGRRARKDWQRERGTGMSPINHYPRLIALFQMDEKFLATQAKEGVITGDSLNAEAMVREGCCAPSNI